MNESDRPLFAALVIDAGGRIVAANASARVLWGAAQASLVNRALVELLAEDAGAPAAESEAAQWDRLRKSILDQTVRGVARPIDGGAPCPVQVRLERAQGGGGTYMATVMRG